MDLDEVPRSGPRSGMLGTRLVLIHLEPDELPSAFLTAAFAAQPR